MRQRLCAAAMLTPILLVGACSGAPAAEHDATRSASPSASAASPSASSSAPAQFPRTPVATALGDLAALDVCGIAASADVGGLGNVELQRPAYSTAGVCSLTSRPTGALAGSARSATVGITVASSAPRSAAFAAIPVSTTASGLPLLAYPFDSDSRGCARVLVIRRTGVTSVVVAVSNRGGAGNATPTAICVLNNRIVSRFAQIALGTTRPSLPKATPSLRAVDVCKAATAAKVASVISASGAGRPTYFGAGCAFTTDLGRVDLVAGALTQDGELAAAAVRQVHGHRLVLLPLAAPECGFAFVRGREIMTARLTSATDSVPADCVLAGEALAAYLDVLGSR